MKQAAFAVVPRKDYERILELSDELPKGFYFSFGNGEALLKLRHKDLPEIIALDLFAADFITNDFSISQSLDLTKKIIEIQKPLIKLPLTTRRENIQKLTRAIGFNFEENWEKAKMLCYGTEFCHSTHPSIFINIDFIFPLTSIEFEGNHYPCPKDVVSYLTLLYRDFRCVDWSQPTHCKVDDFTVEEMLAINRFVQNH